MHGHVAIVVVGLASVLALAMIAAHPRVKEIERRLGINVLIGSGLPFLAIGFVFGLPRVGILTDSILSDLRPAFNFAAGWIGFVVGVHLDIRRLDKMPQDLSASIAAESLAPMATTFLACGVLVWLLGPFVRLFDAEVIRDTVVLVACAAASAPISGEYLVRVCGERAAPLVEEITRLDEVAALSVLAIVGIFLRDTGSAGRWVLPGSAWLLVCLGLGSLLGVVAYVLVRGAKTPAEELALLLGSVSLTAGIASYLALAPPVVCAIAGAMLTNLPLPQRDRLTKLLEDLERPLLLVFLVIVGAAWRPMEWQGWVLGGVFVVARVAGKVGGSAWARAVGPRELPPARHLATLLTPQSAIGTVIVVAAPLTRPHAPEVVGWMISAVLVAGVLNEIVVVTLRKVWLANIPPPRAASQAEVVALD